MQTFELILIHLYYWAAHSLEPSFNNLPFITYSYKGKFPNKFERLLS